MTDIKVMLKTLTAISKQGVSAVINEIALHVPPTDMDALPYLYSGNYYEWYATIASYVKPSTIMEIGVRYGYSAMAMLYGSDDATYVGYDNESGERGSNDYARSKLGLFTSAPIYVNPFDTQDYGKLSYPDIGPAQLIHVDGHHTPEGLFHDLDIVLPYWDDRGLIIVDDVIEDRALYGAGVIWCMQNNLKYALLGTYRGLLIICR